MPLCKGRNRKSLDLEDVVELIFRCVNLKLLKFQLQMEDEKETVVPVDWCPKIYYRDDSAKWRPKSTKHLTKKAIDKFIEVKFRLPEESFTINYDVCKLKSIFIFLKVRIKINFGLVVN